MFTDYSVNNYCGVILDLYLLFERVHYCSGSTVTKSGYDNWILRISRRYLNFDNEFTDFSVNS